MSAVRQTVRYSVGHDDGEWVAVFVVADKSGMIVKAPDGRRWYQPAPFIDFIGAESGVLGLLVMAVNDLREDPDHFLYELMPEDRERAH